MEGNSIIYDNLPLESGYIRLLTIDPGTYEEPLCCSLRNAELDQNLQYEALSYSWGGSPRMGSIALNGVPDFQVTRSLFSGLKRLRHPQSARDLWVDAVCINQADMDERASQVRLMGLIYSRASQVCVWLGEPADMLEMKGWTSAPTLPWELEDVVQSALTVAEATGKSAWWHRAWVIQEVILARSLTVYIGSDEMTWEDFTLAMLWAVRLPLRSNNSNDPAWVEALRDQLQSIEGNCRNLDELRTKYHPNSQKELADRRFDQQVDAILNRRTVRPEEPGKTLVSDELGDRPVFDLEVIMHHAHHAHASLAHDLVYALLPLTSRSQAEAIPIDYRLDMEDIFASVGLLMLKQNRSLHVKKGTSWKKEAGQPLWSSLPYQEICSWIPDLRLPKGIDDWSVILPKPPPSPLAFDHLVKFEVVETPTRSRLLAVRGVFLEKVFELCCCWFAKPDCVHQLHQSGHVSSCDAPPSRGMRPDDDDVVFLCCGAPFLWLLRPVDDGFALLAEFDRQKIAALDHWDGFSDVSEDRSEEIVIV